MLRLVDVPLLESKQFCHVLGRMDTTHQMAWDPQTETFEDPHLFCSNCVLISENPPGCRWYVCRGHEGSAIERAAPAVEDMRKRLQGKQKVRPTGSSLADETVPDQWVLEDHGVWKVTHLQPRKALFVPEYDQSMFDDYFDCTPH